MAAPAAEPRDRFAAAKSRTADSPPQNRWCPAPDPGEWPLQYPCGSAEGATWPGAGGALLTRTAGVGDMGLRYRLTSMQL